MSTQDMTELYDASAIGHRKVSEVMTYFKDDVREVTVTTEWDLAITGTTVTERLPRGSIVMSVGGELVIFTPKIARSLAACLLDAANDVSGVGKNAVDPTE